MIIIIGYLTNFRVYGLQRDNFKYGISTPHSYTTTATTRRIQHSHRNLKNTEVKLALSFCHYLP